MKIKLDFEIHFELTFFYFQSYCNKKFEISQESLEKLVQNRKKNLFTGNLKTIDSS